MTRLEPRPSGLWGVVAECTSVGLAPQRTFSAVGMPLIRGDPPPIDARLLFASPVRDRTGTTPSLAYRP